MTTNRNNGNRDAAAARRNGDDRLDLAAVRKKLAGKEGPRFWRSLEELSGEPGFQDLLEREFPRFASEWPEGVSRRGFLQLMAASVALGGLTACTRQPAELIVPYVHQPPELTPSKTQRYASAFDLGGFGTGVVVESHQGRPIKMEGNELHPASLGGTDAFTQASVLSLYDPDRSRTVNYLTRIRTWDDFVSSLRTTLAGLEGEGGARLAVLTPTVTSPTLTAAIEALLARYPRGRWVSWEPVNRDAERVGARTAFGAEVMPRYDLSSAEVILSLDSDFLTAGPGRLRYAHDFAEHRRPTPEQPTMSRLYALESTATSTGGLADHRRAAPPHLIARATLAIARDLGVQGIPTAPTAASESVRELDRWVQTVVADLRRHPGRSLVVASDWADAETHAVVLAINERLGNLGSTLLLQEPVATGSAEQTAELTRLTREMRTGRVDALLIVGGNPAFNAPADLGFAEAMREVPTRVRIGLYDNETSELCHWHLPASHDLEAWGDIRAYDGTASIIQPLIEPLYGTRSGLELIGALAGESDQVNGYELTRQTWMPRLTGPEPEEAWRRILHDGVIEGTQAASVSIALQVEAVGIAATRLAARAGSDPGLTVSFRPDPSIWDGRFANSGWLQECPKPASKLTWDNALVVAPATAVRLGLAHEQMVRLQADVGAVDVPVWTQPGQAENTFTLHLGYGRRRIGRVGNGVGFDVYPLRPSGSLWVLPGVQLTPSEESHTLVSTQMHHNIDLEEKASEAREVLRSVTLAEYAEHPEVIQHMGHAPGPQESLYPEDREYDGYAWGMAIDLNACTGCNACVIACVAENNIPVVGKEQVARGREMQWIRIDRYFEGDPAGAAVHYQPVTCMQCENAPCEVVCPVGATSHTEEGLNDMVYNRCVGTRYCSNNCPYKVRRFNFFNWNARTPNDAVEEPVRALAHNPDVTVRSRGVMEKCTYCVQRIEHAKIQAHIDERQVQDGEIVTACQAACPSNAIVFGDINDPESEVSRWKAEPRDYGLLADLGTRPRTTYLAKIRNANPAMDALEESV